VDETSNTVKVTGSIAAANDEKDAIVTNVFKNTADVTVTKIWVNGNSNKTLTDLVLNLLQKVTALDTDKNDGTTTTTTNTITSENNNSVTIVKSDNETSWAYTFASMVKYLNGYAVEYTVDEPNVPEGYTASTVQAGDKAITNTFSEDNLTTLTITKAYDGTTTPDKAFTFDITLSDTDYNGDLTITRADNSGPDTVEMTGGKATVELKVGDTVTIPQVYSNTTYTVKEQYFYGFRVKTIEQTVTAKAKTNDTVDPDPDTKSYTSTYTGTTTTTPSTVALVFTNETYYPPVVIPEEEEPTESEDPSDEESKDPGDEEEKNDSEEPSSSTPSSSKPSDPNESASGNGGGGGSTGGQNNKGTTGNDDSYGTKKPSIGSGEEDDEVVNKTINVGTKTDGTGGNPSTGDTDNVTPWIVIGTASGAVIIAMALLVLVYKRQK
jgi:hypothetical protein